LNKVMASVRKDVAADMVLKLGLEIDVREYVD
jgi:hypothetical protein